MDEKKKMILQLLAQGNDMFTLEIAKRTGTSAPTMAKYLEVLKAEGKVTSYKRLPYVYWKRK